MSLLQAAIDNPTVTDGSRKGFLTSGLSTDLRSTASFIISAIYSEEKAVHRANQAIRVLTNI
jgi:hypothetical protein